MATVTAGTLALAGFPSIYGRWLNEVIGHDLPAETKATCDSCPMCEPAGTKPSRLAFRPDVKCCTYEPTIPNFLVGLALGSAEPKLAMGRASLLARIEDSIVASPLHLAMRP